MEGEKHLVKEYIYTRYEQVGIIYYKSDIQSWLMEICRSHTGRKQQVAFLDNDLELGRENWDFTETHGKRDRKKYLYLNFIGQCMVGLIGQSKLIFTTLQNIGQEENKIEFWSL